MPLGFHFVRASRKQKTVDGPINLYLKCWRYGKRRGKTVNLESVARPNTKSKACGCLFQILAKTRSDSLEHPWFIRVFEGERGKHNHNFTVYKEGHRPRRGLPEDVRGLVRGLTDTGSTPANIMTSIKQNFHDVTANVNQIYNYRSKLRVEEMEGRTPIQHCLHLATENGYLSWVDQDEDGALRQIFMANPFAIRLVRTYPYVILIDTTYKTNNQRWPFCEIVGVTPTNHNFSVAWALMRDEQRPSYTWALERLRNILGHEISPNVIITDREEALSGAIADVFPGVPHFLCLWHIGNNVEKKVDSLTGGKQLKQGEYFRKFWWNPLVYSRSLDEYEENLLNLRAHWIGKNSAILRYLDSTWLKYKEKFICAYTDEVLHMNNVATSRVESQHSSFKYYLGSSRGSFDRVWRRAHFQIDNQQTAIKKALQDSMTTVSRMKNNRIYRHLTGRVSHHALDLIEKEWQKMLGMASHVTTLCDHVLWKTCGLPCACTLYNLHISREDLYLGTIHKFWRTLVVDDGVDNPDFVEDPLSQDKAFFQSLVDEVNAADPAMLRHIANIIDEHLHPESRNIPDPECSPPRRGRPSIGRSTRRDRSAFEYGSRRVRGRGSSGTTGRSTSRSTGRASTSSVGLDFDINLGGTHRMFNNIA